MFLPTSREEMQALGWRVPDIILVTGDAYIDSPYIGVAVIGKILLNAGFRVGVIPQPDIHSDKDIRRLGEPELFWGVSGGSVDSMVANYTAGRKFRKTDDYTPGGLNGKRPDRAVIVYSNLIRRYFKNTKPIVLGGIEASLRRLAHYDFWSNEVRRSILFDAKADYLVYGMGEKTVLDLARGIRSGSAPDHLPGICRISREKRHDYIELPSFEQTAMDKQAFIDMFKTFYANSDPLTAKGLCQRQDNRYLIQNPPAAYLTREELDAGYDLEFERDAHPSHRSQGTVKAIETIRFSIPTHQGCYGECNFCAIAVHQGRTVRWRSPESILTEARLLTKLPDFRGRILDIGGPTANMYGIECSLKKTRGSCRDRRCLYPDICPHLRVDHKKQLDLLNNLRSIPNIKQVFVASGLRHDLVIADRSNGDTYLREIVRHHISGQLKVAPEHSERNVLSLMGKPEIEKLVEFRKRFVNLNRLAAKSQFLTYYLMAAHPGCRAQDMRRLQCFSSQELKIHPEQIQIFTPAPSTFSSLMYHTEMDPFSGEPLFVEKNSARKQSQKEILLGPRTKSRQKPHFRRHSPPR
ncbi:MAG: YgiQ family radical SAM protein [Thermodesulfobacteriota bacterium]